MHINDLQTALMRCRPKGRDLDVLCIPVPALPVLLQRVKGQIVINAMLGRGDPRNNGRMTRIGHGRQDAAHGLGIGPVLDQGLEVGDRQPPRLGIENIGRLQPINRDQQDGPSHRSGGH